VVVWACKSPEQTCVKELGLSRSSRVIWYLGATVLPAFTISWVGGWCVRKISVRCGFVDRPGLHKTHQEPTALGGGLAIWLALVSTFATMWFVVLLVRWGWLTASSLPEIARVHLPGFAEQWPRLAMLLGAATIVMLVGLADDMRGLPWQWRLGLQLVVALVMVWQGWQVTLFLPAPILTGLLSALWFVGLSNSFNMLDNMDGLSAGVAAIASLTLAGVMLLASDPATHAPQLFVGGFLLVLFGALAGFLVHNHPPARLFMGDAGSTLIGFCLAAATIAATFAGGTLPRHAILAPLCVMAVPLYDTVSVVAIRMREGRSPFYGDRSHMSHRLVEMGLTKTQTVWTIYLLTATTGLAALLLHQVDGTGAVLIAILVGCVIAVVSILEFAGRGREGRKGQLR